MLISYHLKENLQGFF